MSFRLNASRATLLLASTLAGSFGAEIASAQTEAGTGGGSDLQEIVVTGSRIARPANLVAPNPVVTLSAQDIQSTGLTSTAEILDQLPQSQNSQTPINNNRYVNGEGLQFINLRGLGAYRTLVLVDGRRHIGSLSGVNNSGGTEEVDVSTIAPLLIDHIDTVTTGSSAAYGANAVAGVVNFIMKKNYQGLEVTAQEGGATEGGDSTTQVDAIWGSNFADDRGNITVGFDFANQAAVKGYQRDQAVDQVRYAPNPVAGAQPNNVIYSGSNDRRLYSGLYPTLATDIPGNPTPFSEIITPNGVSGWDRGIPIPTNSNYSYNNTGAGYDVNQVNNLSAPNNRKIVNVLTNYRIAEDVGPINTIEFFSDIKYADSRGQSYNGNNPNITGVYGREPIPASNPYIPAALRAQLVGYTGNTVLGTVGMGNTRKESAPSTILGFYQNATSGNPALGGWAGPVFNIDRVTQDYTLRRNSYEYQIFRGVFGFQGKVFNNFDYEVYYNYGQNDTQFYNQERLTQNYVNSLDSVIGPGGNVVCRSSLSFANGCVPLNPFKVGPLTPEQFSYLYTTTHENDRLTEHDFAANVHGDLFSFPTPISGSVQPVGFAFGGEYREEDTNSQNDPLQLAPNGTISGNNAGTRNTIGGYKTREFYVETSVPLLHDLPFAKAVDFDGAIRFQSFSTTGDDWTWNARGTWAFSDDFSIRGGFAKAVRTPNGDELYSSGGESFTSLDDPCQGINGSARLLGNSAARQRNCAGIPIFPTPPGTPFTAATNIVGNPRLMAETAQTENVGAVFTPTFIPRFTFTTDYYAIKVKNAIEVQDSTSILNGAYDSGNAAALALISRNSDGSLNVVQTPYVNAGALYVSGVDFQAGYILPLSDVGLDFVSDEATLGFNADLNWTVVNTVRLSPTLTQYLAGELGYPHVKGIFRVTYDDGPFLLSTATRYYSQQAIDIRDPTNTFQDDVIPDLFYQDFYLSYRWKNLNFFAGVQNAFNNLPPHVPTVYTGGNFPDAMSNVPQGGQANPIVDIIGRYVFGGLTVKF